MCSKTTAPRLRKTSHPVSCYGRTLICPSCNGGSNIRNAGKVQHDIDEAGMQQDNIDPAVQQAVMITADTPTSQVACKHPMLMQSLNKMQQSSSQHLDIHSVQEPRHFSKLPAKENIVANNECICNKMRLTWSAA